MNKWECKYCGSTNNADYRERCWACGAPAPTDERPAEYVISGTNYTGYISCSASYPFASHSLP